MGVIAGWLSLMLALSFRARRWIGHRGWRLLHYASFAAFGLALLHALAAGTDFAGVGGHDRGGGCPRARALAGVPAHPGAADTPARAGHT